MTTQDIIAAILTLLSGIGIFLIACSTMSSNLESIGSDKLRSLFSKVSGSKTLGVTIGTLVTAAIQSSGATSVMVIGFVNAGIMPLIQAVPIVFGANLGTTVTGQIVALGMGGTGSVTTTVIFSALAGVGAFMLTFAKKEKVKKIGSILAGFGMLFVGLKMMSSSMSSFAQSDSVRNFLAGISSPVLLCVIGMVLTAIVQSSSVMTSVAITMLVSGLISLDQGIYITIGSNVGACVVAVFASFSSNRSGKRTALIHVLFNLIGGILFLLLGAVLKGVSGGQTGLGTPFESMFANAPQTQLAMFHTAFNVLKILMMLPFTEAFIKLSEKLIPDEPQKESPAEKSSLRLYYVDENMLKTPPIAVQQTRYEIINMAELAFRNFQNSLKIICEQDFSGVEAFRHNEEEINFINRELVHYIVKLAKLPLSEEDRDYLTGAIRTVSDMERVGDYAENIVEYAESLKASDERFSVSAVAEIEYMNEHITKLYELVMKAYIHHDMDALNQAEEVEELVDNITDRMADNHIIRLNEGTCTPMVGAQYLSLASNSERVADHFMNVAHTLLN